MDLPELCVYTNRSTLCRPWVSVNEGDGYEKATLKVQSRRAASNFIAFIPSFSSANVGNCFWSWILKDCIEVQEKKHKSVVLSSRSPQMWNQAFSRRSRAVTAKNVQKSVMPEQSGCFA